MKLDDVFKDPYLAVKALAFALIAGAYTALTDDAYFAALGLFATVVWLAVELYLPPHFGTGK